MEKENTLGGFSAMFDELGQNGISADNLKDVTLIDDPDELSDDIYSAGGDDDDEPDMELPEGIEDEDDDEEESAEGDDEDDDTPEELKSKKEPKEDEAEYDKDEAELTSSFFDALAEEIGWSDVPEEERPKSVPELVEYMKNTIEENAKPQYASKDVELLDQYVKNGGSIESFLSQGGSDIDYDQLDTDDVEIQRALVTEYLIEKGFTKEQVARKVSKYEDADILDEEAKEAVEELKVIKEERNKELLEAQKKAQSDAAAAQQEFYGNVVKEIEGLDDIRGIKIPKEDKKELMRYIFEVESDGRTRYQKDYLKSNKALIESAYLQMKGDKLLSNAKKAGETAAVDRFRKTLESTKIGGTKRSIDTGSATPLWALASKQLINRPK